MAVALQRRPQQQQQQLQQQRRQRQPRQTRKTKFPHFPWKKSGNTPAYPHTTHASLEAVTSAFRNLMHTVLKKTVRSWRSQPNIYSNMSKLDRLALSRIAVSSWVPIPTDKDGGYALMSMDDFYDENLQAMKSDEYEEIANFEGSINDTMQSYLQLCRAIGSHSRVRADYLTYSADSCMGLASTLKLTVKRHKPQGTINTRKIHSSASYPFAGLGKWLCHIVQPKLLENDFILQDTRDLIRKPKKVNVTKTRTSFGLILRISS